MNKTFRDYAIDQPFLLPPDLRDWLPEDHLALFVADVVGQLDLTAIYRDWASGSIRTKICYEEARIISLCHLIAR